MFKPFKKKTINKSRIYFEKKSAYMKRSLVINIILDNLLSIGIIFLNLTIVSISSYIFSLMIKKIPANSNSSTSATTTIVLISILSFFIILNFFLGIFFQFYKINMKYKHYRRIKREIKYYSIKFNSEENKWTPEEFVALINKSVKKHHNNERLGFKQFIIKYFRGEI
ncbi:unknown; predicted coding region [Mycoplasmopsis pulmonis]|uniref:Uncharacterized protein n=1 Tax=Mycoplasmopsis pulmonis (strain UAB CTIP) TaxID=272635 RepID=Q98R18_MYCPU|nr:hypothetical protein [Mycoplasmopsis pulmonis]MDZ7293158.1 hypothetical protein [Mycoplasmopsis pulmonis]CAC13365.1 unknown; predicted coding region [Mycoplasmopsis pulmonis]VEU67955.1 Uncharacterised protein [Mycoplasmopsis pulmonis]